METTADLVIFIGIAVTFFIGCYIVGRIEGSKEKREMKKRRRAATNYARMVNSSGVIKGGQ